MMAVLCEECVC